MATAPPSLSGILNLPKLEQLFGQLLTRIAHQEAEIDWLRQQVQATNMDQRLSTMESRLRVCEAQCAVPGGEMSAGRCSYENRQAIARLADMVDRKVDEADARLALEEIRREMSAEAAKTRTECVSDEYGRRLEASCSALGRRMAAAEAAIATKVDESLVSGLEATCERLRVADAQVMACAQRQDTCEAALVACAKAQDEERDSREALAAATKADLEHLEGIDKNHAETLAAAFSHLTRSDATTHAALERIDALDRTAERIVLRCDQTEDLCRGLVSETRADLANNSRSLQRAIDRADDTAFARDAVNAASSRDDLRLFVRRLKADHIDDIRLKIAAIQAAQNTMSHSLDVALKFVDWFANRGHAYEHNLNAIDRTLASMVLADRANYRSVRFTP